MAKFKGIKTYIPVAKSKEKNQPNLLLTEDRRDIYLQVPLLSAYRWKCLEENENVSFFLVHYVG
jgi:hypothetical protein